MWKKAFLLAWAGFFILAGCANEAREAVVRGQQVKCEPPGDEAKRTYALGLDFSSVFSIAKGKGTVETKWQRIRQVSPKGADFDIIAWRLCESYANGIINREVYEQMMASASGSASGAFDPEQLRKKFVLTGDVFEEGNPGKRIEGAEVELTLEPLRYAATSVDGTFSFVIRGQDEGKAPTLRVRREGYEIYVKPRIALTASRGALPIPLRPHLDWFPVRGRVVDAEAADRGVEEAQLILETVPPQRVASQSGGEFLLKVPKDYINKDLKLRVEKPPRYQGHSRTAKFSPGTPPVEIRLGRARFVFRATVVASDKKGEGLEGAVVTLKTDPPLRDRTRSDGGILFQVLAQYAEEFVPVRVEKEGYETHEARVQMRPGQMGPELVLKPLTGMGEYRKCQEAFQEGDYAKSVELCARATQINPNLSPALFDLGRSQAKLSDWEAAAKSFRRASDLEGGRFDYQLELAKALVHLNRFKDALPRFERAASLQPNNADIYFEWARTLASDKQPAEAVKKYRQVISLSPNRYEPYEEASRLLYDLGRQRDEAALVEESLQLGRKAKALKEGKPAPTP